MKKWAFLWKRAGFFIFDVNTPYKHRCILGNETFTLEDEDAACIWTNELQEEQSRTRISIDIAYAGDPVHCRECFYEYYCAPQELEAVCVKHGFPGAGGRGRRALLRAGAGEPAPAFCGGKGDTMSKLIRAISENGGAVVSILDSTDIVAGGGTGCITPARWSLRRWGAW